MSVLHCKCLHCRFIGYRVPGNPDMVTDMFLGDYGHDDIFSYSVCTAEKDEWEAEINANEDSDDVEYVRGGDVPICCPIYRGLCTPKWEEESEAQNG